MNLFTALGTQPVVAQWKSCQISFGTKHRYLNTTGFNQTTIGKMQQKIFAPKA